MGDLGVYNRALLKELKTCANCCVWGQMGVMEALLEVALGAGGVPDSDLRAKVRPFLSSTSSPTVLPQSPEVAPKPKKPTRSMQALRCIGDLIAESQPHKDRLAAAIVATSPLRPGPPRPRATPALMALLGVAMRGEEAAERGAADTVLRTYCLGFPEGQSLLASTLGSSPTDRPGTAAVISLRFSTSCFSRFDKRYSFLVRPP